MKILIDMNLSPDWCMAIEHHGWESIHWSAVGDPKATDAMILAWALAHGYVVFTHDLDYGALLAATRAKGPSVIQVRTQDVLPDPLAPRLMAVLKQHEGLLKQGALVSIDESRARIRILPLFPNRTA